LVLSSCFPLGHLIPEDRASSSFLVSEGSSWTRLLKINDIADDCVLPCSDHRLHNHPNPVGFLARMGLRAFATPLTI
jgi:hypothetical protein